MILIGVCTWQEKVLFKGQVTKQQKIGSYIEFFIAKWHIFLVVVLFFMLFLLSFVFFVVSGIFRCWFVFLVFVMVLIL